MQYDTFDMISKMMVDHYIRGYTMMVFPAPLQPLGMITLHEFVEFPGDDGGILILGPRTGTVHKLGKLLIIPASMAGLEGNHWNMWRNDDDTCCLPYIAMEIHHP